DYRAAARAVCACPRAGAGSRRPRLAGRLCAAVGPASSPAAAEVLIGERPRRHLAFLPTTPRTWHNNNTTAVQDDTRVQCCCVRPPLTPSTKLSRNCRAGSEKCGGGSGNRPHLLGHSRKVGDVLLPLDKLVVVVDLVVGQLVQLRQVIG